MNDKLLDHAMAAGGKWPWQNFLTLYLASPYQRMMAGAILSSMIFDFFLNCQEWNIHGFDTLDEIFENLALVRYCSLQPNCSKQ